MTFLAEWWPVFALLYILGMVISGFIAPYWVQTWDLRVPSKFIGFMLLVVASWFGIIAIIIRLVELHHQKKLSKDTHQDAHL